MSRPIRRKPLCLELLESRQMLSTVASFDNDRLSTAYAVSRDAANPPPAKLAGGAIPGSRAEYLRVYSGVSNNLNSVAFERTDVGPQGIILADFDFRLTQVHERPDGLSFSLVNTVNYGISGPVLAAGSFPQYAGSLGIALDTFKNDRDPSGDSVKVYYNTQLVEQMDVSHMLDMAGGQWIHARISLTDGKLAMQLTPAAGETMTVFNGLTLPNFVPFESRAVFSGWSGGAAWGNADLDNVNVQYATTGKAIFSWKPITTTVDETTGTARLTVERRGDLTKSAYLRYATQSVTAMAGQDFLTRSGTLSFAAGEQSKSVSFSILNDSRTEPHEQFVVWLSSPSAGSILAGPERQVVTIVDDERGRQVGDFSDVLPLPNEMIHAILLPTVEVLSFDQETGHHTGWLWNPQTRQSRQTSMPPEDSHLFCSGHTLLADGRVFFAGGHQGFMESGDPQGLRTAILYNPFTDTWEVLPEMEHGRRYPTVLPLPSGEVVVMGGYDETGTNTLNRQVEIYSPGAGGWTRRNLDVSLDVDDNRAAHDGYLYERSYLAPSSQIFLLSAGSQTWWLNVAAEGTDAVWTLGPPTIGAYSRNDYGTATMGDAGKILLIGGGGEYEGLAPQAGVEIIDLNTANPQWKSLDPLPGGGRRHLNTTALPGGDFLVTGGTRAGHFNDATGDARQALHLKPAAAPGAQWETWDTAASPRLYHSTALLLPSGKVLTAGSGQPHAADSWDQRNAEVFSPTYIYKNGRPVISSMPTIGNYGQKVSVKVNPETLSQVVLMKLGSITHGLESNARRVPLSWTKGSVGTVSVTLPTNPNAAPPGHYLLFVLDSRGVPSEGKIFQLLPVVPPVVPTPPPGMRVMPSGESDTPSSSRLAAPSTLSRANSSPIPPTMPTIKKSEGHGAIKQPELSKSAVDRLFSESPLSQEDLIQSPLQLLRSKASKR